MARGAGDFVFSVQVGRNVICSELRGANVEIGISSDGVNNGDRVITPEVRPASPCWDDVVGRISSRHSIAAEVTQIDGAIVAGQTELAGRTRLVSRATIVHRVGDRRVCSVPEVALPCHRAVRRMTNFATLTSGVPSFR